MKKNIIILGALAISSMAFSQVGINTETPKTTLDVKGKTDSGGTVLSTDITGMQAPRLTRLELTNKGNSLYGTDQTGAIIYITDVSGGNNTGTQRANVTAIGYYYFDGNAWQKISNGTLPTGIDTTNDAFVNDPANSQVKLGTKADGTARATTANFAIKDNGNVQIGTSSSGVARLSIEGSDAIGNYGGIHLKHFKSPGGVNAYLNFETLRGSDSSPQPLVADDITGNITFSGYANSARRIHASITGKVQGSPSATEMPISLVFSTKRVIDANNEPIERMRITPDGNVGIGTLSPTAKLDVNGRINAVDQVLVNKGATEGGQIKLQGQNVTDADWTIDQINNLSTPRFRIFAGSNEDNGIAISESGNVGLGTSTPNTKLHINTTTAGAGFRLVDGTQGTGKVLSSNASGNASWVTNVAVAPTIIGETDPTAPAPTPPGSDYAIANNTYLKRKITLPSGKWIIMIGQTFNNLLSLGNNEGYMTHIYLGGTTTSVTLPAGVTRTGAMGANVIYSASGVSISTGSFLINNTNTSDVTLYLIFGSNDYFHTSSGLSGKGQVATAAGENYLYAIPIN